MQFACVYARLSPFYGSNVKECNLFTSSFCSIKFLCGHSLYVIPLISHAQSQNFAPLCDIFFGS